MPVPTIIPPVLAGTSMQILRKFLYLIASFLYWTGSDKVKYDLKAKDSFREECGPLRPLLILTSIVQGFPLRESTLRMDTPVAPIDIKRVKPKLLHPFYYF